MFRRIIILSIISIVFCLSFANARVSFIPDSEIELPDSFYIDAGTTFEFKDINNDYVDEVIVENHLIIASYSLKDNQTIDYFVKPQDTLFHQFTYGYIDDDSLFDFVEFLLPKDSGVYISPDYWPDFIRRRVQALIFLSSQDFISSDTIDLVTLPEPIPQHLSYSIELFKKLFWDDTNSDGVPEIYFQLQVMYGWSMGGMLGTNMYRFYGYKYVVGNDSAIYTSKLPEHGLLKYHLYDDSVNSYISIQDSAYFYYMQTHAFNYSDFQWTTIRIIQKDSLFATFRIPFLAHCYFEGYDPREFRKALLSNPVIGDFVETSPRYELIGSELQYFCAWAFPISFPGPPWTCTTMTVSLVCYDLSSPLSFDEIWRVEYDDVDSIDLVFSDSLYTKKFFVFRDDRFYLHNSENGELLDSSVTIDLRILDYRAVNACHPQEEAIFVDDNRLIFYRVGVITSVDDKKDKILPVAFRLGQPYPNPYNARLSIPIEVARKTNLKVEIFDILGRYVAQVYNKQTSPGELILNWDSEKYSSGIYFIRARTDDQTQTAKAILLK